MSTRFIFYCLISFMDDSATGTRQVTIQKIGAKNVGLQMQKQTKTLMQISESVKSIRFFAVKRPRISLLSAEIIVMQTKNSGIHRKRDTIMSKTPKNNLAIIIRPFFYIKMIFVMMHRGDLWFVIPCAVLKEICMFFLSCLYNTIGYVRKNGP